MKKIILSVTVILGAYSIISYYNFDGFIVGYKDGYPVVFSYACADVCTLFAPWAWQTQYYGKISYDECMEMKGKPRLVGLVGMDENGKPLDTGLGGYVGCKPK